MTFFANELFFLKNVQSDKKTVLVMKKVELIF